MTKVTPEILDLFFGNIIAGDSLKGNTLIENGPKSQTLFSNIMTELIGGENGNQEILSGNIENLLGEQLLPEANSKAKIESTNILISHPGGEILNLNNFVGLTNSELSFEPNIEPNIEPIAVDSADKLPVTQQSDNRETFFINNGNAINELLSYEPVKIDQGKYQVLESKIKGDNLSLILSGNENQDEIIKLDIPLEILSGTDKKTNIESTNNGNSRVSLLDNKALNEEFSNLISKLKVKSIEIKQIDDGVQHAKDNLENLLPKKLNLTVIAEDSGRAVVINSEIKRSDVKSFRKINSNSHQIELTDSRSGRELSIPVTMTGNSENKNPDSLPSENKNFFNNSSLKTEMNLVDKSWSFESKENSEIGLTDKLSEDKSSGAEKLEIKSTRFTLPDNIKSELSSRSKSVLIKLNPEHLGPAKLKLSLRNDILSARLLVDNVQVKAIVENSLDRLFDQLAKADIKVDKIEVAIDYGATGERMFNQNQHWKKQFFNKFEMDNEEFSREIKISEPIISRSLAQTYLSGTGVNILA